LDTGRGLQIEQYRQKEAQTERSADREIAGRNAGKEVAAGRQTRVRTRMQLDTIASEEV
jgi:hypothetical protein